MMNRVRCSRVWKTYGEELGYRFTQIEYLMSFGPSAYSPIDAKKIIAKKSLIGSIQLVISLVTM